MKKKLVSIISYPLSGVSLGANAMELTKFMEQKSNGGWFIKICCKDRDQLESPIIKSEIKSMLAKEVPGLDPADITYDPFQPVYPVDKNMEPLIGNNNRPKPNVEIYGFCKDFDVSIFPKFNVSEHNKNTIVVQYGEMPKF